MHDGLPLVFAHAFDVAIAAHRFISRDRVPRMNSTGISFAQLGIVRRTARAAGMTISAIALFAAACGYAQAASFQCRHNQSSSEKLVCNGRVEMWRGSSRFGLSVAASFVWRCPNNLALTPFPHPAHRTGHADLPHPALGQDITPSYTAGSQPGTSQTHETEVPVEVLGWISPAPATSNLVLVA